jgi:TatD DNase family protein
MASKEVQSRTKVVDIGVNLTHKSFHRNWREVIRRAIDAGVDTIILTGTSLEGSKQSLQMAQQWYEENNCPNLYTTIGVHPHEARTWNHENDHLMMKEMRNMLKHPLAVAVGECGLDYNRLYSSKEDQRCAFCDQLKLAVELNMPLFLHEREAHEDFIQILDEQLEELKKELGDHVSLPPIVIHCFTGTKEEALSYTERGYYIGFTGIICKEKRGEHLREIIQDLPLDRLMVETDAPFMGFKGRKPSEPADCVDIARKLSDTVRDPFSIVCETTMLNAKKFFNID